MRNIWFLSPLVPSKREKNVQTETTGGPRLVRFLGFWKNRTTRNSYYLVLHSQFPLVRILLHSNSTSTNFIPIALKFVLVEFVLVETVLVGDPLYLEVSTFGKMDELTLFTPAGHFFFLSPRKYITLKRPEEIGLK